MFFVHVLLISLFGNIIVVTAHNLGLAYEVSVNMLLEEEDKEKRSQMMEGMSFVSSLFRSMKNLSKDVIFPISYC